MFANSYAKAVEERAQGELNKDNREEQGQDRSPHFVKRQKNNANGETNSDNQAQAPQPMEVDSTSMV